MLTQGGVGARVGNGVGNLVGAGVGKSRQNLALIRGIKSGL